MMNEDFQMFGIHVYLQDPNKLTCLPVTSDNRDSVTSPNVIPRTKRPNRTQRTGADYEKASKSESYEIDVIEYKSSAFGQHEAKMFVLLFAMVILIVGIMFKMD